MAALRSSGESSIAMRASVRAKSEPQRTTSFSFGVRGDDPATLTTSPASSLRPRRVSTSPFTSTSPAWIRTFASPPEPTRLATLSAWTSVVPVGTRNAPSVAGRVAHRHDQVQKVGLLAVSVLLGHDEPRLERFVELEDDLFGIYGRDAVEQVAGVEGDQKLVLAGGGEALVRVPHLAVAHDDLAGTLGEREANGHRRRLAGGKEVDPSERADEILPGDGYLPLEFVGQKPPVLGKVPVDEPGAEDHVAYPEQRLVLRERDLDVLLPLGTE